MRISTLKDHAFSADGTSRAQLGSVLITALVFMVVLTMVAVVAMRSTTLDFKITTNNMLKARAFENSETGRGWTAQVLDAHVFNRGYEPAWPDEDGGAIPDTVGFTLPAGLSVCPCPGTPDDLWAVNNVPLADYSTEDLQYRLDGNGDGDFDDAFDVASDLFITRLNVVPMVGGALAQISGYEGFGKGAAAGGAAVFFDSRSRGASLDSTSAIVGGDVRIVIRN
ncbi:MAG: hypothetical protein GWN84_25190 [Gammaproteobacteria bacterium]|nr:hypothetical protein [Gammaproteobacteria bacterium]NIR85843.1 hypothetical protein [Gammaproteobacteria bacterium]NIR90599.1 hypothetical protein [Gammaproteobacteria bacterium]NIU06978.1 hypothetical protein [Gammaproteobacteria bacterium]NIV75891.1 hypothetical protein [Gammaproteobacteria bacterium]